MTLSKLAGIAASILLVVASACADPPESASPETDGAPVEAQPSLLAGQLARGPHPVGFRAERVALDDAADASELPSAVDLYLWYPAAADGGGAEAPATMTFGDYYSVQEETPRLSRSFGIGCGRT